MKKILSISHTLFLGAAFTLTCLLFPGMAHAHQTPVTIAILDVGPGSVTMELQLPLPELELSFGHNITKDPEGLVAKWGPQLREYLVAHIRAYATKENPWLIEVKDMTVGEAQQVLSGPAFREITVHIIMKAPAGVSTRKFTLDYDVIMHEVITHTAFVSVRNDWETGKAAATPVEAGVIRRDTKDNLIYPLQINLQQKGNWWNGFASMVSLVREHIAEGTDHLLFLLVLLLPAPLLVSKRKWAGFGGTKYSIVRLLKIVTAFTIGHSATLILGALGWIHLPVQPIEVLIAFSILVSAVHAMKPLFPNKESYIAMGFGLIHGLAFAGTLVNLNLEPGPLALSILGFNIGIELMQLFVVIMVVPWLMLLSQTKYYGYVRIGGAALAAVAALAWITERTSGESNFISRYLVNIADSGIYIVAGLAIISIAGYMLSGNKAVLIQNMS